MSDITLLKRMFEQNFKLNEPIESTLKPYEACYFNGTVWTRATALIAPTGFLAEKLVDGIGNIALGSEVPVDTLSNTALLVPIISNAIYYYDPATRLLNTVGTGYKIGTGYAGSGSSSQYGSIIVNLNQSSGGGGSGTVTNVSSANTDISVVNGSVAPVLTFDRGTTVTESGFTSLSEFFTYVGGIAKRITSTDLRDWYTEPGIGGASTMRATIAETTAGVIDNRFVTPLGAAAVVDTVYGPTITESGITIASELPIREAGTKRRITLKDVKDFYAEPSLGGAATMRATAAETTAGTLDNVFVTPLGLQNKIRTGYTVASLPTGVIGDRAYVTDALTPAYGIPVTGGGSIVVPVFKNATVWITA